MGAGTSFATNAREKNVREKNGRHEDESLLRHESHEWGASHHAGESCDLNANVNEKRL